MWQQKKQQALNRRSITEGVGNLVKCDPTASVELLTLRCNTDFTRCTMEYPSAQLAFNILNSLSDIGLMNSKGLGCSGKASIIDDLDENSHAFDDVHLLWYYLRCCHGFTVRFTASSIHERSESV